MTPETKDALQRATQNKTYLVVENDPTLSDGDVQEIAGTIRAVPTLKYLTIRDCALQYHRFNPILDEALVHPSITRINASGNFGIMAQHSFIDAIVKNNPRINVALADPIGPLFEVSRMYNLPGYLRFFEGEEGIERPTYPVVNSLHRLMSENTLAIMSHPFIAAEPSSQELVLIHTKMPNLLFWDLSKFDMPAWPLVGDISEKKRESILSACSEETASSLMGHCALSKIKELDTLCNNIVCAPRLTATSYRSDTDKINAFLPSLLFWAEQLGERQEVVKGIMVMNRSWEKDTIPKHINIEPFMTLADKEACGIAPENQAKTTSVVQYPYDSKDSDASRDSLPIAMIQPIDRHVEAFPAAPTIENIQKGIKRVRKIADNLPDVPQHQLQADIESAIYDPDRLLAIPDPVMKATRDIAATALELTAPNLYFLEVVKHVREVRESFAFVAALVTKTGYRDKFFSLFGRGKKNGGQKLNLPVPTSDNQMSFEEVIKQAVEKMKGVAPLLRKMAASADKAEAFSLGQAKLEKEIAEAAAEVADCARMQQAACVGVLNIPTHLSKNVSKSYNKALESLTTELGETAKRADSICSHHEVLGTNGTDIFQQMRFKGMTTQVTFAEAASKIQNRLTMWMATEAFDSMSILEGSLSELTGAAQMREQTTEALAAVGELTALAETAMKDGAKPKIPKKTTMPQKRLAGTDVR
ncbi:MAG: hypothetical protein AB7S81_08075 [Bdellovibrionales bacterium]